MLINWPVFVNLPTLAKRCLIFNNRSGHWQTPIFSYISNESTESLIYLWSSKIWCARDDLNLPGILLPPPPQGSASTSSATYARGATYQKANNPPHDMRGGLTC